MSNKTISINPSLFSVTGSKTKKNREKILKPSSVPLISPNILKNKLLKRIKEHKQKETQNLDNNKKNLNSDDDIQQNKTKLDNEILNFSDEFTDSINYLQTLSKSFNIKRFFSDSGRQKTLRLCAIFVLLNKISISLP